MGLRPGAMLGFFLLILVHELGHAVLVRAYRLPLQAIEVHGMGGVCRYSGRPSPVAQSVIAWGGVLAQGLVFGGTIAWLFFVGRPQSYFVQELFMVFLQYNLIMIALNLLPVSVLDGKEAWQLPMRLWRKRPRSTLVRAPNPPPIPRNAQVRPLPRTRSGAHPFASQPGASVGGSGPPSGAFPVAVIFEADERLPAETEAYLRAVLERARKKAQPKN